jgi:hypothetical protein
MKVNERGWTEWEQSDFKRHGFLATYLIGKCRCKKCAARIKQADPERPLRPRD